MNVGDWESRLINELVQGRELGRRLQACLHAPSTSQETCVFLIHNIIAAFERALATVNFNGGLSSADPSHPTRVGVQTSDSPPFTFSGSPLSEDSDRDFHDHNHNASKKRYTHNIHISIHIYPSYKRTSAVKMLSDYM